MKKYFVPAALLLVILLINQDRITAQEITLGSFGITAAINNAQADILFPIRFSESSTIAPAIGIASIGGVNTDISAGLVYHHYIKYSTNFSPTIGLRAGAIIGKPKDGTSTTDWIAGLLGGGEYFFSSNFSVGVEAQLNFTFSDKNSSRFGNPDGTNINTGTVIFATVYF